jgi:hypothetical protein
MCDEQLRIPPDWIGGSGPIGNVSIPILKDAMYALRLTLGEPLSQIEADRRRARMERK